MYLVPAPDGSSPTSNVSPTTNEYMDANCGRGSSSFFRVTTIGNTAEMTSPAAQTLPLGGRTVAKLRGTTEAGGSALPFSATRAPNAQLGTSSRTGSVLYAPAPTVMVALMLLALVCATCVTERLRLLFRLEETSRAISAR